MLCKWSSTRISCPSLNQPKKSIDYIPKQWCQMDKINVSNLLLEYNFVFKLHCISLLVKMLHVLRRRNSVKLVPTLTLSSAIILRLKNENCDTPSKKKKKSKEDNKTQQQNAQRGFVAVYIQNVFTKIEISMVLITM